MPVTANHLLIGLCVAISGHPFLLAGSGSKDEILGQASTPSPCSGGWLPPPPALTAFYMFRLLLP